ncbi:hypothetical protein HUG17_0159 [Dermatophagoides farinae]|uniref:Uncharacterized protein n=1 Tax=Dermatophagoides farinae TaxID=6954 RepID=A0A9D4P4J9_DERFA|nr:hypothetical protein HUG17_0159 [Dermatophagoides farinae]
MNTSKTITTGNETLTSTTNQTSSSIIVNVDSSTSINGPKLSVLPIDPHLHHHHNHNHPQQQQQQQQQIQNTSIYANNNLLLL